VTNDATYESLALQGLANAQVALNDPASPPGVFQHELASAITHALLAVAQALTGGLGDNGTIAERLSLIASAVAAR
jgi:hypothetical protein